MSSTESFKSSLDRLVLQAQKVAQLGVVVAKGEMEAFLKDPNTQMETARENLQRLAHEMETKAQELVHMATTYVQQSAAMPKAAPSAPKGAGAASHDTEPHREGETVTAAGVGTAQEGSDPNAEQPTAAGDAAKQ